VKISSSIRSHYEDQLPLYKAIEQAVKEKFPASLSDVWHFEGRVKSLESYAQKLETGQVEPSALEDFYACTLVVPTLDDLGAAEALLSDEFDIRRRKPSTSTVAQGGPFEFPFDHIRVYAQLRVPLGMETGPVFEREFEIQVKTFLQHAWSIATHDLTYKATEVSWGTERVAAQVKAMLEAAEVSIVQAKDLAGSSNILLSRVDSKTSELIHAVDALRANFSTVDLPADVKRLASNSLALLQACGLEANGLADLLARGKIRNNGNHPVSMSPYSVVFYYLTVLHPAKMKMALTRKGGRQILIPHEVEVDACLGNKKATNGRTIRA
jgi:ppGpp synthetase/RelA/SpoT-type nucleotidyltranferase